MKKMLFFIPLLLISLQLPAYAVTAHCPDHSSEDVVKIEAEEDGELDDIVLEAGTVFCVKGSTDQSGILEADGETTLFDYLDNGHSVSYVVIYEVPEDEEPPNETTTTTTTTQPPPTTTTTQSPTTTTTRPSDSNPPTTNTTQPVQVVEHNCVTPDGYPYSAEKCLEPLPEQPAPAQPVAAEELPRTGSSVAWLFFIGCMSVFSGLVLRMWRRAA